MSNWYGIPARRITARIGVELIVDAVDYHRLWRCAVGVDFLVVIQVPMIVWAEVVVTPRGEREYQEASGRINCLCSTVKVSNVQTDGYMFAQKRGCYAD